MAPQGCNKTRERIVFGIAFGLSLAVLILNMSLFIPAEYDVQRQIAAQHTEIDKVRAILGSCPPALTVLNEPSLFCIDHPNQPQIPMLLDQLRQEAAHHLECTSLNATQLIQDVLDCRVREYLRDLDNPRIWHGWLAGVILSGVAFVCTVVWMFILLFGFGCYRLRERESTFRPSDLELAQLTAPPSPRDEQVLDAKATNSSNACMYPTLDTSTEASENPL